MSDAINELIRKVEIQKLQIQTELLYQQNMALFKERFPTIFEVFEHYTPQNTQLGVDPNGDLNLINRRHNHYVYSSSPAQQAQQHVERFSKKSMLRKFKIPLSEVYNPEHIYIPHLNKMVAEYSQQKIARLYATPNYLVNLILSGIGMGYQLPELINRFDIQNIFIYENCKDTFHASLHVFDWQPILDYFRKNQRSITFCIGVVPRKALSQIEYSIREIGLHTQMFTFVYQHSQRKEELDFISIYQKEIKSFIGGVGYFDDEQIGLGHAYHNIMSNHAVFRLPQYKRRHARVAVVANGPSLDNHIEYLEKNQQNIIILSCGSALGSLYRAGIQPDFHVEMERDYAMTDFIKYDTPKEFREKITLLCLHSVAPETLNQFGKSCYAVKILDAGAPLIHKYFKQQLVELSFCNPTVSNCALAFAVYLGFDSIHLIGTDFGIPANGQHHASNSLHYKMEEFVEDKETFEYNYTAKKEILQDANFGGQIKTHHILDISRISIERLLDFAVKQSTGLTCFNSNDGAKIRNATPTKLHDITAPDDIDKSSLLHDIESQHFHYYHNKKFNTLSSNSILKKFFDIKDHIKIKSGITSNRELMHELNRIFTSISQEYDPTTYHLLRGSLSCFFGSIVENTLYAEKQEDFDSQLKLGTHYYNTFIDLIYQRAKDEPFKIDDFPLHLIQKMRSKESSDSILKTVDE